VNEETEERWAGGINDVTERKIQDAGAKMIYNSREQERGAYGNEKSSRRTDNARLKGADCL
jgi:hypothetical protein